MTFFFVAISITALLENSHAQYNPAQYAPRLYLPGISYQQANPAAFHAPQQNPLYQSPPQGMHAGHSKLSPVSDAAPNPATIERVVQCPPDHDYRPDKMQCEAFIRQNANVVCANGCTPDVTTGRCNCLEEQPQTTGCPVGYTPLPSSSKKPKIGAEPLMCQQLIKKASFSRCENPNFNLINGECVGHSVKGPEFFCEEGTELVVDVCVKKVSQSPDLRCPPGFKMNEMPRLLTSSQEQTWLHYNSSANLRLLGWADSLFTKKSFKKQDPSLQTHEVASNAAPSTPPIAPQCIAEETTPASPVCPSGYRMERNAFCVKELITPLELECVDPGFSVDMASRVCSRNVVTAAELSCQAGYFLDNGRCTKVDIEDPQPQCREGFHFDLKEVACIKVLKEAPRMVCQNPDYYYNGQTCQKRESMNAQNVCPNGILKGDVCVNTLEGPSRPSCPAGFTIEETLQKCFTSLVEAITFECPIGYRSSPDNECLSTQTATPVLTCPDSFLLNGNVCDKDSVTQAKMTCSAPYQLLGGECLASQAVSPVHLCEPGFTKDGTDCVLTSSVPGEKVCLPGFTAYNEKCIRQHSAPGEALCSVGYTFDGIHCVIRKVASPSFLCPDGFAHDEQKEVCVQETYALAAGINSMLDNKKTFRRPHDNF